MITTSLPRAVLLAAALCLTACDKTIEERGCDDEEVHLLARKLLVMRFKSFSTPKTSTEGMMQPGQSSAQTNGNASNPKPDGVQLSDVKTLYGPSTPRSERPVEERNTSYRYGCTAKAHIELAASAAERLAKMPDLARFAQLDGRTLTVPIRYITRRAPPDFTRLEVGVAKVDPPFSALLEVALRPQREPQTAAGAASTP